MEKVQVKIFDNETNALAEEVAQEIVNLINKNNSIQKSTVLGLATGNTPLDVYRELIRLYKEGKVDFSQVITFNLDEYYELPPTHENSYNRFMDDNLFNYINVKRENIYVPQGLVPPDKIDAFCHNYEEAIKKAGGVDIQLLGIGRDGHIGFNEPLSKEDSRMRLVELDPITLNDAVREFSNIKLIPTKAITMGVGTIMEAKKVILIATGDHKASIIKESVEGECSGKVVASYLQKHKNTTFYLDKAAASELTKISRPWLAGEFDWSKVENRAKAVCFVSEQQKKAIEGLEMKDFELHSLLPLVQAHDLGNLKKEIISFLKAKIIQIDHLPAKQKVLVLSPHSDDEFISLGGTLQKLLANSNEIMCAHMTSGTSSVEDCEVQKFIYAKQLHDVATGDKAAAQKTIELVGKITDFLQKKRESRFGFPDIEEMTAIKSIVRNAEAISACNYLGNITCAFLPGAKVDAIWELFKTFKPTVIYACGDLTDPNSPHRICWRAIQKAYENYPEKEKPQLWAYRTDSPDYHPVEADFLIPLSNIEVTAKRNALLFHQSQNYKHTQDSFQIMYKAEKRQDNLARYLKVYGIFEFAAMEALKKIC
jgi:glucosamine-6-phosphate deaminase